MTQPFAWRKTAVALLGMALGGCASWQQLVQSSPGVSQKREERSQQVVQEFEAQRTKAQLSAALDRWQQGDIAGCESRLRTILAREPNHLEARLRLAELAWSCDDYEAAKAEYRQALAQSPGNQEIREALQLLEASSQAEVVSGQ
jgi:Tfp pilus assembly protein PilF